MEVVVFGCFAFFIQLSEITEAFKKRGVGLLNPCCQGGGRVFDSGSDFFSGKF